MSEKCATCPEHGEIKANQKNLWAIILLILAGVGGFLVWNQTQLAGARAYTDVKIEPVLEMRDTVLTMEINLKNLMEAQGVKYQERKK